MSDNIKQDQDQAHEQTQQQHQNQTQQQSPPPGQQGAQQDMGAAGQSRQEPGQAQGQAQERRVAQPSPRASGAILIPPVDVIEDAGGITLLADLPGVAREGLHLRIEANSLTIDGALTLDLPQQMESRYAEVKHQHYQRTFALSKDLDAEQAVAELNHGVLRLRIPKARHAQPRKIEIQVA